MITLSGTALAVVPNDGEVKTARAGARQSNAQEEAESRADRGDEADACSASRYQNTIAIAQAIAQTLEQTLEGANWSGRPGRDECAAPQNPPESRARACRGA